MEKEGETTVGIYRERPHLGEAFGRGGGGNVSSIRREKGSHEGVRVAIKGMVNDIIKGL